MFLYKLKLKLLFIKVFFSFYINIKINNIED
jgi:hypothetical protein